MLPHERWQLEQQARDEADRELKRRRWEQGWPYEYVHRLPFMYASSFVLALDHIQKSLIIVANKDYLGTNSVAAQQLSIWKDALGNVKGVRDSMHHSEDRARGQGKKGPLELKPVSNDMFHAPGGVLSLGNLNGNRYGWTTEDGHHSEVEVSEQTLVIVRDTLQVIIDSLQWRGYPAWAPM